jgi:hypothetical protein
MLIEAGILLATYSGIRLFEKWRDKHTKKVVINQSDKKLQPSVLEKSVDNADTFYHILERHRGINLCTTQAALPFQISKIVQRITGISELKQCFTWPYSFIRVMSCTTDRTQIIMIKLIFT